MSKDAARFVVDHVRMITPLEEEVDTVWWEASRTDSEALMARLAELNATYRRRYADPDTLRQLEAWLADPALTDPVVRRELTLLAQRYRMNQMPPEALEKLSRAEAEIEHQFNTARAELNGKLVSDNDLKKVLHHETDSEKCREAWEASKKVGALVADRVIELVRTRNEAARALGYRDFYAMSLALRELDEEPMFEVLDQLRDWSEAPFLEFKADLDADLRARFDLPADAPLYPWHYQDPFFQEVPTTRHSPDLDALFAGRDLLEMSRRFFSALHLEIDDILAVSDLYERPGKCQHAFCTRLNREGDARILVNLRENEKWGSTLLHELGHAVYDKYVDLELPWLLRSPAHMLSTEAVALFFGRFTKDYHWLNRYAGLETDEARDIAHYAGLQARAGQIIFARWGLVMIYFERELYRDPDQDLNGLWWRLVQDLQGVTPPPGRNAPDWAAKIHLATTPVYYQNYVLGELVASQMVHHLLTGVLHGEHLPLDALVRSHKVGEWLIDRIFKPGALRPWNEALEFATGEKLNPQYFVQQFLTPRHHSPQAA